MDMDMVCYILQGEFKIEKAGIAPYIVKTGGAYTCGLGKSDRGTNISDVVGIMRVLLMVPAEMATTFSLVKPRSLLCMYDNCCIIITVAIINPIDNTNWKVTRLFVKALEPDNRILFFNTSKGLNRDNTNAG